MNHSSDTAAAGNGGTFGPEQAAALLDQTTRQARQKFRASPPWLLATRGVMVLLALGAIWLTVRGQHPYRGPTAADIPILIAFIVINFTATVTVRARAVRGVSGQTRFSQGEIVVLVVAFVASVLLMVGLSGAGVSLGWYPTSVMVLPGAAWAIISAIRSWWADVGTGVALVLLGVIGAVAGPVTSWAVAAVGLFAIMLASAVVAWRRRA